MGSDRGKSRHLSQGQTYAGVDTSGLLVEVQWAMHPCRGCTGGASGSKNYNVSIL